MHSTSWKFSTSVYILFMSSKRFGIFSNVHILILKIWNICVCEAHTYSYLHYWEIYWHGISWKLTLRMLHEKMGDKLMSWIESCDFTVLELLTISANVYNFLVKMSTFKQIIKFTFEHNKFGTRTVQNSQTRILFSKKSCDQVDKLIDHLHLSKSIPNVDFNFISCQETCK